MTTSVVAGKSAEKRRFPRYDVAIPVFLRKKTGDLRLVTADVSRHGAFIKIETPHPLRQLVQLRFQLGDTEIDAMCMVARWLGPETARGPGMGVDFFALSKDAKNAWERFLTTLKASSSPPSPAPMPAASPLAPPATTTPPVITTMQGGVPFELEMGGPPTRAAAAPAKPGAGPLTTMMAAVDLAPTTPSAASSASRPDWLDSNAIAADATRPPPSSVVPLPGQALIGGQSKPAPSGRRTPPPPPMDLEEPVGSEASVVMLRMPDTDAVRAFIENEIGRGGMFLKTPLLKNIGDKVEVVLVHPETDEEFHLDGTVVRRVIQGPPDGRGLGIFFRALSADAHKKLLDFAESGIEVVELAIPVSQRQVELEDVVGREPDSAEALEALGAFLLDDEGDLGGALTFLTRALVLGPSQISIHASLARAYRKIGDLVKVRAHERVAEALMLHQDRMKVRLGVGDETELD